jgi:hypothetical protein
VKFRPTSGTSRGGKPIFIPYIVRREKIDLGKNLTLKIHTAEPGGC